MHCIYLWSVLSLLAIFAHTTLLGFRLEVPLEVLLAAAGALCVIDGACVLVAFVRRHNATQLTALTTVTVAAGIGVRSP